MTFHMRWKHVVDKMSCLAFAIVALPSSRCESVESKMLESEEELPQCPTHFFGETLVICFWPFAENR